MNFNILDWSLLFFSFKHAAGGSVVLFKSKSSDDYFVAGENCR